jgi:hypothetical protein
MSMIDAAFAVLPERGPRRLNTRGKFGMAVYLDVPPDTLPSTFSVEHLGVDLELVSGELDGVHFEGVAHLGGENGNYSRMTLRMHETAQ